MTDLPLREKLERLKSRWYQQAHGCVVRAGRGHSPQTETEAALTLVQCADELSALLSEDRP